MPDPSDRAIYGEADEAPSRRSRLGGIVAVVAMLGFGVGLWYVYDRNIQRGDSRPPTVVAADKGPVKTAPADPGGMQVQNTQTGILNQGKKTAEPKVESLLPPPERPRSDPPPAPKAAAPVAPPPPAAVAPPPAPAPVPSPPPAAASMPAVPAPAVEVSKVPAVEPPKVEAPPASPAPPTPVAPVTPPKTPVPAAVAAATPPPAAGGGVRIQLASLPDAATAEQEWKRLQKANGDVLGNLTSRVVPVQLEGKGTWYRLQAGPFADKAGAQQACEALKQRKLGCFLAP